MARVLADTNLWLRAADPDAKQHLVALDALKALVTQGHLVCLSPQVLMEYWAVATRPKDANGFGWDTKKAGLEIEQLRDSYPFLIDREEIFPLWFELVRDHEIKGKRTHDTRIAAVMAAHRVEYLLSFNGGDFATFPHVRVLDPTAVASGAVVI